jgi:hypothetical protein
VHRGGTALPTPLVLPPAVASAGAGGGGAWRARTPCRSDAVPGRASACDRDDLLI